MSDVKIDCTIALDVHWQVQQSYSDKHLAGRGCSRLRGCATYYSKVLEQACTRCFVVPTAHARRNTRALKVFSATAHEITFCRSFFFVRDGHC